ncbi:hypothetical protein FB45DRAFT_754865 [Roridomyces roridus]|uniref:DUF7223 domain-containing protein n=1 Tax=Roridomyces roridus TaxID=1738132 RepID=A0AAD7BGT6_9AGAR|nr:hypothetical protein FB45DRAFT_754865 [Roridomyces roridus]
MISTSFLALIPFILGVNAANDWNVPCTTGSCAWDLPAGSASGTMKIWGSNTAISDITTAANWQILGCNSTALSQSVRLVCMNDPEDPDSLCSHLYGNSGAVNKIIRLPTDCGAGPFARVSQWGTSNDQSIPASVNKRLTRRAGNPPVVHVLAMDTNFDAVDYSKTGAVNIAIQGANVPGAPNTIAGAGSGSQRRSRTRLESAAKSEATKVKNAAGKVESAAKAVATKVEGAAKAAVTATNNTVDVNHTFNLPPITFDKSKNLLSKSIQCGPVGATISADVDANANAQMTVSLAATGTIIPPKLTDFGVVAGMSGSAAGTMTINADVTGSLDSGLITLVNLGVPGFDIPGIFTVGPSFQVNAELTGDVDVAMAMTLGVNLNLNNAQLAFPPGAADPTASNAFSLGDTPITLNAAPNVDATGTITAHLIPSLNLGISALGKKADATISLSLDANAGLTMNLDGSASATKVVEPNPNADDAGSQPADVSGTIGGCINVNGGVDVTASADADFFGLFDKSTSANLFSKNFQILQVCFRFVL